MKKQTAFVKKGRWTEEENSILRGWVEGIGALRWEECSKLIQGRNAKQCREHWINGLNPIAKKGGWTNEEDCLLFKNYSKFGNRWAKIASELPGRTENSIKNRFYSTLRSIASSIDKTEPAYLISTKCLLKYIPMAIELKTTNAGQIQKSQHNEVDKKKIKR